MSIHDERAVSQLTELAGRYIAREAGRETLITPTHAALSSDGKHATIYVSVFPDDQTEHALAFLARHKDLFRDFLKKEARFARLPFIAFELDYGERNRQHLDEISRDL